MEIWASLITAISALLVAIATLITVIRSLKQVRAVHIATNSMKDALVAEVREASLAKGRLEGIISEKERKS